MNGILRKNVSFGQTAVKRSKNATIAKVVNEVDSLITAVSASAEDEEYWIKMTEVRIVSR